MATLGTKQILIFFSFIAVFSAFLIGGVSIFLRLVGGDNTEAVPSQQLIPESAPDLPGMNSVRTEVRQAGENELVPSVVYDGQGFQPIFFSNDGEGVIGCVIIILNSFKEPLKIGLNPHEPFKDTGPDYGAIAPADKLIFDPRFVGVKELKLHNHNKPYEEFTIAMGPKCQL